MGVRSRRCPRGAHRGRGCMESALQPSCTKYFSLQPLSRCAPRGHLLDRTSRLLHGRLLESALGSALLHGSYLLPSFSQLDGCPSDPSLRALLRSCASPLAPLRRRLAALVVDIFCVYAPCPRVYFYGPRPPAPGFLPLCLQNSGPCTKYRAGHFQSRKI